jgi:hypothetical protein
VQKRFNPDEIRATEISLGRLGRQRREGKAKDEGKMDEGRRMRDERMNG